MVWRCSIILVLLLFICGSVLETSGQRVRQKLQQRKSVDYFYEKPSYDFEVEDSKSKESDKRDDYKTKMTDYVPDLVKSAKKIASKEKSTESMGVCDTLTCPVGRVCVPGGEGQATCVCGGEDVCVGHKKRVCGTDGVWYPSHCELHRIACVQARHIGVDRDGKNCRSKHGAPVKAKAKVNFKAKQPTIDKPSNVKVGVSEKVTPKVKDTPVRQPCTRVEYEQFKASLLKYHCVRTTGVDCTTSRGRQAVSDMLAYYDTRRDNVLDGDELMALEHRDHIQRLSRLCHLGDLITFDDTDFDGSLTTDEFNRAFSSQVMDSAPTHFTTVTTAGGSLEIKCDSALVKVGWRRGQYSLPAVVADAQIRIVADGSLYFGRVGHEHAGNYSCYDLVTGVTSQLHTLKVYSAPIVRVTPSSQFHREGATVTIQCHATALPAAQLSWTVNGRPVSLDNKHYRLMGHNSTLEVASAELTQDSGTFTCQASNSVGSGHATASVLVDNVEADKHGDGVISREQFLVFHRGGYTVYDPLRCLLKHTVSATFSQLPATTGVLCDGGECQWSGAVNVRDRLVYVAQPTLNRVLVLDMDQLGNVLEVIATDKAPSSVQYVAHLDQVWVTCDTSDKHAGDKYVAMVIRGASDVSGPHQVVHTEPVGGHYDVIKKMFVGEQSEVGTQWRHAYVLHDGQMGLSKLSLDTLKYVSDIELKSLDCVPQDVTFLPIGGGVAVNCVTRGGEEKSPLVFIDALTDAIVSHTVPSGRPYVSPDGRRFVVVRDIDNSITVSRVDDAGAVDQLFVTYADFKVAKVTFIASSSGQGYDMYVTSASSATILSVNLSTGHANTITSAGGEKQLGALVGGGEFVMVSTSRGVMAVSGRQQRVLCRWNELLHADVIVWSEDRLFA